MRGNRTGSLLLALGVIVGAAAGVGLLIDFEPSRLPPALLNIAAYKLTFLAAGGLIAAGALIRKYARREHAALQPSAQHQQLAEPAPNLDTKLDVPERDTHPRDR